VAALTTDLLRINRSAALRAAAALELHHMIGAGTHSHDNPFSYLDALDNWNSNLTDSNRLDKGEAVLTPKPL
jgi:hypothetical protein